MSWHGGQEDIYFGDFSHVYLGCCDRRTEERETEEVERHLRAAAERVAYLGAARTAGRKELPAARRRH